MWKKLQALKSRFHEIEAELSDPGVVSNRPKFEELAREYGKLTRIMDLYERHRTVSARIEEDRSFLEGGEDEELGDIAREEIEELTDQKEKLEEEIRQMLLEPDPSDEKNIIVEIRAGTGGGEASLFAMDLFRMYSRFSDRKGWKLDVMNTHPTEVGGIREIVFGLSSGDSGIYRVMKYENGVHRVQRVPETESSGRIHTSAATVVVLPEADEIEMEIDEGDIRVDVFRSSGPGGQSVNTTDSAVRITHLPTGLVVQCQDEKSQLKNKRKALKVMRARLLDVKRREREIEVGDLRRKIVGSGDRSEKIRTYNYPQGRVTDHRIQLTLYQLDGVMDGDLDTLLESLRKADLEEQAATLLAS
jgi:peptide chain release factor 1